MTQDELKVFPRIESCRRNAATCADLAATAQSEEGKSSWLAMLDFWERRLAEAERDAKHSGPALRAGGAPSETYTLSA